MITKPLAATIAIAALAIPATAQARTQTLTVVNHAHVKSSVIKKAEAAIQRQVNGPVHRAWHTPKIRFGRGGWQVILRYGDRGCPQPSNGCHWPARGLVTFGGSSDGTSTVTWNGPLRPYALVATQGEHWDEFGSPQFTETMDHEIIEMVVNPTLEGDEPCDDDDEIFQADNGTWLVGFEKPSYFAR